MFWELAGDYNCYVLDANGNRGAVDLTESACATGNGEYHMGNSMTKAMYDKFLSATPYGNKVATGAVPEKAVDITVSISGFKVGDQNYPINPKVTFTNNTGSDLPGGTEFQFEIPVSAPDNAKDQSGGGLKVIASGHTRANNIGGLDGPMHRVSFSLPNWKNLAAGATYELDMVYYLPISGPANYTVNVNGIDYAFAFEQPNLPLADLNSGGGNGGGTGGGDTCRLTGVNEYPNFPNLDWQGQPSHASGGDKMSYQGVVYKAKWWTNSVPGSDGSWEKCVI